MSASPKSVFYAVYNIYYGMCRLWSQREKAFNGFTAVLVALLLKTGV